MFRPALLTLCLLLATFLVGCGTMQTKPGEITGSGNQRHEFSLSSGVMEFVLVKNYADTNGEKMRVNLRNAQGSIINKLFDTGEEGTFKKRAEIGSPGRHTLEVDNAKGEYTISWVQTS